MIDCPRCHTENPDDARFCGGCGENLARFRQPSLDPLIGQVLDNKYQVLQHLGDGGMAKVYLAKQLSLDKEVAIKIINKDLLQNETQVKRFQREAWSASRLDHPHSIRIIDFGQTNDGLHFIAMEVIRGKELTDVIAAEFPIPAPRVVKIMCQLLSVLAEAHMNKIIHRDLKPDNIMLINRFDEQDFVKVLDFGIAKLQERDPNMPALTMAGIVCGTPEYMSPEQAMGQDLDHRTDIYSCGCILYELLTGQVPFEANNYQAILGMHIRDAPMPPSQRRADLTISPELEAIALKAMAKHRDDRFGDALEMKAALEQIAAQMTLNESGSFPTPAATPQAAPTQAAGGPPTLSGLDSTPTLADAAPANPTVAQTLPDQAAQPTLTQDAPAAKKGVPIGAVIGIVVVVAVLAVVAVLFLMKDDGGASTPPATAQQAQQPANDTPPAQDAKPAKMKIEPENIAADDPNTQPDAANNEQAAPANADAAQPDEANGQPDEAPAQVGSAPAPQEQPATRRPAPRRSGVEIPDNLTSAQRQELALTYYETGNKNFKKGKIDEAIDYYNASRQLNPRNAQVYKKLGMSYMRKRNNSTAKKMFKTYLRYAGDASDVARIQELIENL